MMRRLAFPSIRTALAAHKRGLLPGVTTLDITNFYLAHQLSPRILASLPRGRYAARTIPRRDHAFLARLDLDQYTFPSPGLNGEKYALIVVDHRTRSRWVCCYKSHTSLPNIVDDLIATLERQARLMDNPPPDILNIAWHGKQQHFRVEEIKTDGHKSFLSSAMRSQALRKRFIARLTTPAERHGNNGLVERSIRSLVDIMNTLLIQSGLPSTFAPYALHHAVKVLDLWPQRALNGRSSREVRTGSPGLITDTLYHVFGSTVYFYSEGKQGAKAGIFLGYNPDSKGFTLFNPITDRVISRGGHLVFNEAVSEWPRDRLALLQNGDLAHGVTPSLSPSTSTPTAPHPSSLPLRPPPPRRYAVQSHLHQRSGQNRQYRLREGEDNPFECGDCGHRTRTLRGLNVHWSSSRCMAPPSFSVTGTLSLNTATLPVIEEEAESAESGGGYSERQNLKSLPQTNSETSSTVIPDSATSSTVIPDTPSTIGFLHNKTKDFTRLHNAVALSSYIQSDDTTDPAPQLSPAVTVTSLLDILGIKDEDPIDLSRENEDPLFVPPYCIPSGSKDGFGATALIAAATTRSPAHRRPRVLRKELTQDLPLTPENEELLTPRDEWEATHPQNHHRSLWIKSHETHLTVLNGYKTWDLGSTRPPPGRRPTRTRFVYRIKFNNNVFDRCKARLVALGYEQRAEWGDFNPDAISSPVARVTTIKLQLAHAARHKYDILQLDIKGAYLISKIEEETYIALPRSLAHDKKYNCFRLRKSLPGLRQCGYNFHLLLTRTLKDLSIKQSNIDPCFFFMHTPKGKHLYISTWVDDLIISTNIPNFLSWLKPELATRGLKTSSSGTISNFVGMHFKYNKEKGELLIDQETKILTLVDRLGLSDANPELIPLNPSLALTSAHSPRNSEEELMAARKYRLDSYASFHFRYRMIVGLCGFLSFWGRGEVIQAVYFLARFQSKPGKLHMDRAYKLVLYLKGTASLTTFFGNRNFPYQDDFIVFVDSDHAGAEDMRSTTGVIAYAFGSPILMRSTKQKCTTRSSTESEIVAASQATAEIIYLRQLFAHYGISLPPTPLKEDNNGCIAISRGGGSHSRRKHIRIHDSWLFQAVKIHNLVDISRIRSEANPADLMTKALTRETFLFMRDLVLGHGTHALPAHLRQLEK